MYDWPEERAETDALWAAIRDALRAAGHPAPDHLTRTGDLESLWRHPDLVLGQACGLPYSLELHDETRLVGTFDPGLPGLPPGHYQSVIAARAGDPRGPADLLAGTLAVNAPDSQSGWGAVAVWAKTQRLAIRGRITLTGAHVASAEAVADGRADIASIDAVTWAYIERHRAGIATRLREVARTAPTPGLPLISALRFDPETVAAAIDAALGPGRLVRFAAQDYTSVPRLPFPRALVA